MQSIRLLMRPTNRWALRLMLFVVLFFAATIGLVGCGKSFEVITESEYSEIANIPDQEEIPRAPPVPNAPKIDVLKPGGDTVKSPFEIDIRFVPAEDAEIVADSVRIIYVKGFLRKDLTDRIRPHVRIDETGIHGEKATIPAGKHRLLVEVSDSAGRLGEAELRVRVIE